MAPPPPSDDRALSLALAIVASSTSPLLLLDGELLVVAASGSFCRDFGVDPAAIVGRPVFELDGGAWDMPRLRSLLTATATGVDVDTYELDLCRPRHGTRRLVLDAHRLDYAEAADSAPDSGNLRLLLAVADITDARAAERQKDDLIREKAVLLQEIQHRVANSLQIIASVLMQSARKVQSEETRGHLQNAHHRVMSIAAVQKQLAAARHGEVELRPYFAQLCASLSASMIDDPTARSITVEVDGSAVKADVSVSLGLVVTELVINALKHAFPDDRPGRIVVDYRAHGHNWTLSVSDDGIGMPADADAATPGLGTSIVHALAKQLGARITVAAADPGTRVALVHSAVVGVASNDAPEAAEEAV